MDAPDGSARPDEVERLRAERDALAQEVAALRSRPPGRVRRVAVGVLLVVSWLALALAPLAVWARAQLLETDRWVAVAGPLSSEPAVQAALADWATGELVGLVQPQRLLEEALPDRADALSVPLAGAVTDFVHDRVARYLESDEFSVLWRAAVARAHEAALRVLEGDAPAVQEGSGTVTIDLLPLLQRVLDRITAAEPELFGRQVSIPEVDLEDVPPGTAQRLGDALGVEVPDDLGQITVYDQGRLQIAQDVFHRLGRLVGLVVLLALVAPVAAIWISGHRLRTALHLAVGAVVGLVLVRRGVLLVEEAVIDGIQRAPARGVTERLLDRLLSPIQEATGWMVAAGVLAAVVLYLVSPRPGAVRIRRGAVATGRAVGRAGTVGLGATPEPVVRWVAVHRLALQVGVVAVALVLLWLVDLGWLATVVVVAVAAAATFLLGRAPLEEEPLAG